MQQLNPKAFGLACGATWALGIVVLALLSLFLQDYGNSIISLLSTVYRGYRPTIPGALIGAIWGFIDGFIGGYVFAWLYNRFAQSA